MLHSASHWDSCGQTRPQIAGSGFAERRILAAAAMSPVATVDEIRDRDLYRATVDAHRLLAAQTALGFERGVGQRVALVHFAEVVCALARVAHRHGRFLRAL